MKLISTKGHNFVADAKQSSYPMRAEAACKSKIQYACGQLLRKKFPVDIILEEWSVAEEGFFVDFFLVQRMLAVEVDGAQHDKFNKFFHGTLKAFAASRARDEKKRLFCEMNKIALLRVKSVEELEGILETL